MTKTEIVEIKSKPKPPIKYREYSLVTHPNPQNALTIFEETHRYTPKVMYFYKPPSGKFQSWIIVENEE
jgi:hypothetical protein